MAQIKKKKCEFHPRAPPTLSSAHVQTHAWLEQYLQNAQHSIAWLWFQKEGPCMRQIQSWSEKSLIRQTEPANPLARGKHHCGLGMHISESIMENGFRFLSGVEQVYASVCTRLKSYNSFLWSPPRFGFSTYSESTHARYVLPLVHLAQSLCVVI